MKQKELKFSGLPESGALAIARRAQALARDAEAAAINAQAERENVDLPVEVKPGQPVEAKFAATAAQADSSTLDADWAFKRFPVQPKNEYATPLARLPICRASNRSTQQTKVDSDGSFPFVCSYGKGRRHGPALTIRDEDTLIALMRLRDHGFQGPQSRLPSNIRDFHRHNNGNASVHRVICTIRQINDELGLKKSGVNAKNTLASVKRLAGCRIEIENVRVGGERIGGTFSLIELQWQLIEDEGIVDVTFPPLMTHWLTESYTFINWGVRMQLTPLAKAIHCFLSSQRGDFKINVKKLADVVGYDGRQDQLRTKFGKACDELVAVGWLKEFEFTGNSRSIPLKLRTVQHSSS